MTELLQTVQCLLLSSESMVRELDNSRKQK